MYAQTIAYHPGYVPNLIGVIVYQEAIRSKNSGRLLSHDGMQVMQLLIQHGADVKLRDSMGNSAADIISQRCHGEKSPWPLPLSCSVQSFEVITFWVVNAA